MTGRDRESLSRWGAARRRAGLDGGVTRGDRADRALFSQLAGGGSAEIDADLLVIGQELMEARPRRDGDDAEALALVLLSVLQAARQGTTRLPLSEDPEGPLGQILSPIASAAGCSRPLPALCAAAVAAARAEASAPEGLFGGDDRPLVLEGETLALQRHVARERSLARAVRARAAAQDLPEPGLEDPPIEEAIADLRARPMRVGGSPRALSTEQEAAIKAAAVNRLTLISGGPGTGKTAIVVSLLRVLARRRPAPSAILCAPTGKAAVRMDESIRAGLAAVGDPAPEDRALAADPPRSQTLHRALGYQPAADRFRHHENHPVPADVVIADEASMIDLELADRLFSALRPDASLILLGDADQLPSVDAGAVFRDLAAAGDDKGLTRRLTRSYRADPSDPSGRAILSAARALSRGEGSALLEPGAQARAPAFTDPSSLTYEGVELFDAGGGERGHAAAVRALLDDWYERFFRAPQLGPAAEAVYRHRSGHIEEEKRAELGAIFAAHARCRLLAVSRRLATGSDALNAALHERARSELRAGARADFLPGEPIVMRKNDYRRQLFNGDQGVILVAASPGEPPRPHAVFPAIDGYSAFPLDAVRPHIELAYALTTHRAQGSEYERVAVVLPPRDVPLLTRELLYTALTRARRGAAIAGPTRLLLRASRSTPRFTGLAL